MEFKTSISKLTDDDMVIRGEKLSSLIAESSFSDAIFLLLRGRRPDVKESRLFGAILVSTIDHGMGTASSMAARFVASAGTPLNSAVASGVLALGERHGGATEKAMEQYLRTVGDGEHGGKDIHSLAAEFVSENLQSKKTMYGYGHKVYKDTDPRTKQLLALAEDLDYSSPYIGFAVAVESEIERQKGKKLCLNVDGAIAALLLAMGFAPQMGSGVFIVARTPGLVAQATEERESGKSVRRVDEGDITYLGDER